MEEITLSDVRVSSTEMLGSISPSYTYPTTEMDGVSLPTDINPVTNEMLGSF